MSDQRELSARWRMPASARGAASACTSSTARLFGRQWPIHARAPRVTRGLDT
ncbi:hypothetical protein XHC_0816 [Xanthomonas hortorum pv. carotae str. M081]|nr:hypothetical protein XHC_0816 [Xanthomonas hortorum pv. carotae str. M081]